jgi:hypothetical protein
VRRGVDLKIRQVLLWALALALAGPACARFCKRPLMAASQPPEGQTVMPVVEKGAGAGQFNGNGRLKLNPSKILALQMQELNGQNQGEREAVLRRPCPFTGWLDRVHERWYCRMDNAVRRVDTLWLTEDVVPYDCELSTFKLKTLARVGGRSKDGNLDYKLKFRADFALPGLERKLHLYLDNAGRNALPGADPMDQEDDPRVGLRALVKTIQNSQLDLGGGLRLHSGKPVLFSDLEWRWQRDLMTGQLRLIPRGFWYSDDGFGQTTTLTWTRKISEKRIFQYRTAERSTEGTDGWEFEQSLRFAWLRSGQARGWVAQASVFPHYKRSDWFWDESLVNITWRGALYRKWIYYTLTPQVEFPKEDDYHARPSFRIGLEILMGGLVGDLI